MIDNSSSTSHKTGVANINNNNNNNSRGGVEQQMKQISISKSYSSNNIHDDSYHHYSITLVGDGSEPPFNGKGMVLDDFGTLRIVIPAGLEVAASNPIIYSNYPRMNDSFKRDHFTPFQTGNIKQEYHGNNDIYFEQKIERYGCFDYYVEWNDRAKKTVKKGTLGTFQINPMLTINGKKIPSDGIVLQTLLTKCMGPLENWETHIQSASALGYNMLHYTPVQQIGISGSCYSIYDQLSLAKSIFPAGGQDQNQAYDRLEKVIEMSETKHGVLSMVDLVWNHTANNTVWLSEHPEAAYNIDNSPHLKPAIVLDDAFMEYSRQNNGLNITGLEHLEQILGDIDQKVIAALKLWEYYIIDVAREMDIFKTTYPQTVPQQQDADQILSPYLPMSPKIVNEAANIVAKILKDGIVRDPTHDRLSLHVDLNYTYNLLNNTASFKSLTLEEKVHKYEDYLRMANLTLYREYDADLESIKQNIRERIKYERVSDHGPKLGPVSDRHPLLNSYFTIIQHRQDDGTQRRIHLANNGWIFNHNPSVDFASKESKAYLRRDVIIWGDCVKMRYGSGPQDNPWLWNHMKTYTEKMAKIFHAIRIDNCHSTPIHVAQYLLDAARSIRPLIYVTCELFTGSEEADALYVKRLGINSLIREAMVAHDSWELGRVCHRYGGRPIASFKQVILSPNDDRYNPTNQPYNVKSIKPSLPPALFMDCTHDNQTPNQKRTIQDTLPNAAIVAMTVSAIGSTRGYDEIFPHTIDLVNETRTYANQNDLNRGLLPLKSLLNKLHLELSINKYSEVHIHQEHNVILIQRFSPSLNKSIFLLAHTAFKPINQNNDNDNNEDNEIKLPNVIQIPCKITEFIVGANITNTYNDHWSRDEKHLTGIHVDVDSRSGERVFDKYCYIESDYNLQNNLHLKLKEFPPGSILIFRGEVAKECNETIGRLKDLFKDYNRLNESLENINLVDSNVLLFRHNEEERAVGGGGYHIPGFGVVPFCGLQGFVTLVSRVAEWNDLGHPICSNLRDGDWIMDYIVGRLHSSGRKNLQPIALWLNDCFNLVKRLPRHFIPRYFHQVIITAYRASVTKSLSLMSPFINDVNESGWLVRALALASIQFYGVVTPLISNTSVLQSFDDPQASLAAGLPHFCHGYMRSWGRDTFISLRGLMLTTNRFQQAKQLLVGFGSALRFGLIPNLLDSGHRPRYNSRDSVWWWVKSVQDYCVVAGKHSPELVNDLLQFKVLRLFPNDPNQPYTTILDMIQEIMQSHASGIHFREPHAGKEIDDRMKDEGFNVDIDLNLDNGFLYGGNLSNCGTWMDKMGESHKGRNWGDPATPRDGAPIEITSMLYSTLVWLASLNQSGASKYSSVKVKTGDLTYSQWAEKIRNNFEKFYYIPPSSDDKKHVINSSYVRRRYIYKDTVGSKNAYSDYQFRPNQFISMAFTPDLFVRDHVIRALDIARQYLVGPIGIRTLDPNDTDYHANYDNSLDTDYRPTAKGFNYHNGPEWVWLYGLYLEAIVKFNHFQHQPNSPLSSVMTSPIFHQPQSPPDNAKVAMTHLIESLLLRHKSYILQSPFISLPELTNRDGAPCRDSCDSQAWSIATILASLYCLYNNHN